MSDSDDDTFNVPGAITTRKEINVADVSSDEDDGGTNFALLSGAARKEAVQAMKASNASKAVAAAPAPAPAATSLEEDDDVVITGSSEPTPKRGKGKRAAPPSSRGSKRASPGKKSPGLDAKDAAILADDKRQRAQSAAELAKLKKTFDLGDDDEEDIVVSRRRGGGGSSCAGASSSAGLSSSAGAGAPSRKIWIHVHVDGSDKPSSLMLPRDEPVERGDFLGRLAQELTLEVGRIRLLRDKGGAPLDLALTPAALGLVAPPGVTTPVAVWAEEAAETTVHLQLRLNKQTVSLDVPPAISFGELVARFCAKHGGGLAPGSVYLDFDGDELPASGTVQGVELEDDDLIDVKVRS